MGHARALRTIDRPKLQLKLYNRILKEGLSVRAVEELAKEYNRADATTENTDSPTPAKTRAQRNADFDILQRQLSDVFKTKVSFTYKDNGKGKITFPFNNDAELATLITLFDSIKPGN